MPAGAPAPPAAPGVAVAPGALCPLGETDPAGVPVDEPCGAPSWDGITLGREGMGCCEPMACCGVPVPTAAPAALPAPVVVACRGAPTSAGCWVAMGGAAGGAACVSAGVCDGGADGVCDGVVDVVSGAVVCGAGTPGTIEAGGFTPWAATVEAAVTAAANRVKVEKRMVVVS